MYVECRSLKAWHNTWSQILLRVGHFQWWQACPHFLWNSLAYGVIIESILSKFITVLLVVYCWCSLVANLAFLHAHLGSSNWEDFLHKRWKSFVQRKKGDISFPFPLYSYDLGWSGTHTSTRGFRVDDKVGLTNFKPHKIIHKPLHKFCSILDMSKKTRDTLINCVRYRGGKGE